MKFTAEDFIQYCPSPSIDAPVDYPQMMADAANAKLEKMLAEAPLVHGISRGISSLGTYFHPMEWGMQPTSGDTHTARLVDIKEIGK